jgi:hypothetical protein
MSEQVVNEAYSGIVRCEEEREPLPKRVSTAPTPTSSAYLLQGLKIFHYVALESIPTRLLRSMTGI